MTRPSDNPPVVIVGAGPAGLSAAIQLAEYGIESIVIDEAPRAGGVVYRGPLRANAECTVLDDKARRSRAALLASVAQHANRIEFRFNTQVLGPNGNARELVLFEQPARVYTLAWQHLIVCTGCYERAWPFPGWTLPGVMTLGGAQLQVKSGLVRPANNMLVVGTGPLLPLAARQLHDAGVEIHGVYEAGRRRELLRHIPALLKNLPTVRAGLQNLARLRRAGIPMVHGWGIVEAHGDKQLEAVTVAPYDRDWRPDRNRSKLVETEALAIEYGFAARSELTRLLGLEHRYTRMNSMTPVIDAWCRGTRQGVYVAGDGNRIRGADFACAQGHVAASASLLDSGTLSVTAAACTAGPHQQAMARLLKLRFALNQFSFLRDGLDELAQPDTIVCRCEQVRRRDIDAAIDRGVVDLTTLKMATRLGMGDCQGRNCGHFCADYLRRRLKREDVGELRPRFPLTPLPFDALCKRETDV